MEIFKSFAEYLEEWDAERRATDVTQPVPRVVMVAPIIGSDRDEPSIPGDRDQIAERSIFRGMLATVNLARPVSPLNSWLLATPLRTRFTSQVMGS